MNITSCSLINFPFSNVRNLPNTGEGGGEVVVVENSARKVRGKMLRINTKFLPARFVSPRIVIKTKRSPFLSAHTRLLYSEVSSDFIHVPDTLRRA